MHPQEHVTTRLYRFSLGPLNLIQDEECILSMNGDKILGLIQEFSKAGISKSLTKPYATIYLLIEDHR